MNTPFKLLMYVMTISVIATTACSKSSSAVGCGTASWWTEVESELSAVSDAAVTYGTDPTSSNCEAYISAYQQYINALRDVDNCVAGVNRQEYNAALDEAEEALDDLEC